MLCGRKVFPCYSLRTDPMLLQCLKKGPLCLNPQGCAGGLSWCQTSGKILVVGCSGVQSHSELVQMLLLPCMEEQHKAMLSGTLLGDNSASSASWQPGCIWIKSTKVNTLNCTLEQVGSYYSCLTIGRDNNIPQQGTKVEQYFRCRFDLGFSKQQRTQ